MRFALFHCLAVYMLLEHSHPAQRTRQEKTARRKSCLASLRTSCERFSCERRFFHDVKERDDLNGHLSLAPFSSLPFLPYLFLTCIFFSLTLDLSFSLYVLSFVLPPSLRHFLLLQCKHIHLRAQRCRFNYQIW